jgi:hypothetical protein
MVGLLQSHLSPMDQEILFHQTSIFAWETLTFLVTSTKNDEYHLAKKCYCCLAHLLYDGMFQQHVYLEGIFSKNDQQQT